MFVYDFTRGVFASATASGDRQLTLHFHQRTGPPIHTFANLAVGYGVADTYVHGCMLVRNENDCQWCRSALKKWLPVL